MNTHTTLTVSCTLLLNSSTNFRPSFCTVLPAYKPYGEISRHEDKFQNLYIDPARTPDAYKCSILTLSFDHVIGAYQGVPWSWWYCDELSVLWQWHEDLEFVKWQFDHAVGHVDGRTVGELQRGPQGEHLPGPRLPRHLKVRIQDIAPSAWTLGQNTLWT